MSLENMTTRIESNEAQQVSWSEIEDRLGSLSSVEGGNTDAQRGILTLPEGQEIFVKIGINEHTKGWANKEIRSYRFLKEHGYAYIPELLSINADQTGFATDALIPNKGWEWSDTWNKGRLDATLVATDALAAIHPDDSHVELLKPVITDDDNGWIHLAASSDQQTVLRAKLQGMDAENILTDLADHLERASLYKVSHDTLVHDDVRADNAPWNEQLQQVKLVDWNWLELGDRKIDLAASLTHVHKSGFDVLKDHSDRLDAEALHWMAGFWFNAASKPIWPGGPEKLRDTQLHAGLTALLLSKELS